MKILGTWVKSFHKASYNIIMRKGIKEMQRDLSRIVLNEEELAWLTDNIGEIPTNWTDWSIEFPTKDLILRAYIKHQNSLREERRKDMRIIHGGNMKKLQAAADEGKIGAILKKITGDKPPFSLDSIKDGERQIVDKVEIPKVITKLFRDWFFRSEGDAWRDHNISDAVICEDKDRFLEITTSLKVPLDIAEKIWESCM
jgi:hypothetical protein